MLPLQSGDICTDPAGGADVLCLLHMSLQSGVWSQRVIKYLLFPTLLSLVPGPGRGAREQGIRNCLQLMITYQVAQNSPNSPAGWVLGPISAAGERGEAQRGKMLVPYHTASEPASRVRCVPMFQASCTPPPAGRMWAQLRGDSRRPFLRWGCGWNTACLADCLQ